VAGHLPSGTVTFLFTDVEGSTKLLHELGARAYAVELARHRRVVRETCSTRGGVEVDTQGDAFFFAFSSASGAVAAARAITEALVDGLIHLRIGLHTGAPLVTEEGYVGDDVHFAARVAASGHGGQVLLSKSTSELADGLSLIDLGEHRLKDIDGAVSIYQLGDKTFPPLKTTMLKRSSQPAPSIAHETVFHSETDACRQASSPVAPIQSKFILIINLHEIIRAQRLWLRECIPYLRCGPGALAMLTGSLGTQAASTLENRGIRSVHTGHGPSARPAGKLHRQTGKVLSGG